MLAKLASEQDQTETTLNNHRLIMGSPVRDQPETFNLIQDLIIILIGLRINNPLTYVLVHKKIIPLITNSAIDQVTKP